MAAALAVGAGLFVWVAFSVAGGLMRAGEFALREAWDTPAYFWLGLPLLALASFGAGYLGPERTWRWPLWAIGGQAVGMIMVHPAGSGLGLLPMTILLMGLPLAFLLWIPALLGGVVGRRAGT